MLNYTLFTVMFLGLCGCHILDQQAQAELNRADQEVRTQQLVFDESNWRSSGFAGDGGVVFNDEHQMRLETGYPLTTVVYAHDINYGWIDDQLVMRVQRDANKQFDVRVEVEETKPLGWSAFQTTSLIQNVKVTQLNPQEIEALDLKLIQEIKQPGLIEDSGW